MIAITGKTSSMGVVAVVVVVARGTDPTTTHDGTTRAGHGTTASPDCVRRRCTRRSSSVIPRTIGSIRWTASHYSPAAVANNVAAEVVDAAATAAAAASPIH